MINLVKSGTPTYSAICELTDYKVDHDLEIRDEVIDKAIEALDEVEKYKKALEEIKVEINTPNRNRCDYFIVDQIEKIIKEIDE